MERRARMSLVLLSLAACGASVEYTPDTDDEGFVDCATVFNGPTVGPGDAGPLGFPASACNPSVSGMDEYRCCSDDPAAGNDGLPSYENMPFSNGSAPYFAGANNAVGRSGMCVRTDDLPSGSGLFEAPASDCPVPCNPTWDVSEQLSVCGDGRICCQTRELQPSDCIEEPDGTWRPVTGADILAGLTSWAPADRSTRQDPGGEACGLVSGEDLTACTNSLSVADQRGFCMAFAQGESCPHDAADYLDACEQITMGLVPPPV